MIHDLWKSILSRLSLRGSAPRDPAAFRAMFDRFRDVLESNNKALERITDMGEKLGGDYLFDINYIRTAHGELYDDVRASIRNFDALTQNRHVKLHTTFHRIDNLIRAMVYGAPPELSTQILSLEDVRWDMLGQAGGKITHLADIKKNLPVSVPDAFVITADAFDELVRHNGLYEEIENLRKSEPVSEAAAKNLQELIVSSKTPPSLDLAVHSMLDRIRDSHGNCFLAVRSSAEEEDSSLSFAGQFETVLNVPMEPGAVAAAYKRVLASLFSPKAIAYQRRAGYEIGRVRMAVGCMVMVDAIASGVIYSSDPEGTADTLVISASWGLGESVVEGRTDADLYIVAKGRNPELVTARLGKKASMVVSLGERGTAEVETPNDLAGKPCLTPEQVRELARQAISIERYFGGPRDIEWTMGRDGKIWILQARPLAVLEQEALPLPENPVPVMTETHTVLMEGRGTIVFRGTAAGRVFIVKRASDLEKVPLGSILVAKHDSSLFVTVMPYLSAIITETGTPTSHMAAVCRELKVPTIVNARDATRVLNHGQAVTVSADDNAVTVYDGIARDIVGRARQHSKKMEDLLEFRKKRYVLRYISPLNLIDPLMEAFNPEACRTIHDILRFMHEKAVEELVTFARRGRSMFGGKSSLIRLDLPVPAGIFIMDMGGGLTRDHDAPEATPDQIASVPFSAVIRGIIHPGAWRSEMVPLTMADFVSSMMRMSDIVTDSERFAGYNVAVISKEYVNMSIRFGYHFTVLDCHCSDYAKNNHIYFRFVGGATDIVQRSRRVELIATILKEYGFTIRTKGDLIVARLANIGREEIEQTLEQIGRLIAFTRQLDAVLHDDSQIGLYTKNFLEGHYEPLSEGTGSKAGEHRGDEK